MVNHTMILSIAEILSIVILNSINIMIWWILQTIPTLRDVALSGNVGKTPNFDWGIQVYPIFLTYVFLVQDSIGTLKKTRSLTSRTNHIAGNQVNLVALPTYQVGYIHCFFLVRYKRVHHSLIHYIILAWMFLLTTAKKWHPRQPASIVKACWISSVQWCWLWLTQLQFSSQAVESRVS